MTYAPSSKADWTNLKFSRVRSDRAFIELEKSRPIESWGMSLVNGIICLLLMGLVVWGVR